MAELCAAEAFDGSALGGGVDGGTDFGDDLVGNFGDAAAEDGAKCGKIVCHNIIVLKNYGTKLVSNSARRFKITEPASNHPVEGC